MPSIVDNFQAKPSTEWIEHDGGPSPIHTNLLREIVELELRDHPWPVRLPAGCASWQHTGKRGDVLRWRFVREST
jgi:hypothetical protein